MSLEARLLLLIHAHSTPALDAVFRFSHLLGLARICAPLVVLVVSWHLWRREWRLALVWITVGLSVLVLNESVKPLVDRPRPALWPRLDAWPAHWPGLIGHDPYSFPSGHALVSTALFPLLAWDLGRRWPARAVWFVALGIGLALFVGLGRLYLGVHWPSDVLAGWVMGGAMSGLAIRALTKRGVGTREHQPGRG